MFETKDFFANLDNFEYKEIFSDIESLWDVLPKINSFIETQLQNEDFSKKNEKYENCSIDKNVLICKDVKIEHGASILGPAIIGEGSEIRQGAYIRGNVIIGKNCVIGHASEVKNSIVMNNSNVPHLNYVGDSIIGENVNIGAGIILANFKAGAKDETVFVKNKNKKINTGLRKFGAIIGDNTNIGCNSVLNPGTMIEKNVLIYPLSLISGYIKSNSVIKNIPNLQNKIEGNK